MKITIAMDSFKGSMTSLQAGNAVKNGILNLHKQVDITLKETSTEELDIKVIPVADGGEGTVEALTYGKTVDRHRVRVTGPFGEPVQAEYIIVDKNIAIIEMAQAAGLTLVPEELRNPLHTTTYGVGELILHAIDQGCRNFIVGIGGSATNDCGIGMLQALGYEFVCSGTARSLSSEDTISNNENNDSKNVIYCADTLQNIVGIQDENVNPALKYCKFTVACDVDNPLVGEFGCSRIFAPQKGATPDIVEDMEHWIEAFADVAEDYVNHIPISHEDNRCAEINRYTPGAGAAGGMGYAFLMFLGGKLKSGAQIVIENNNLEQEIIGSDFVITGEGKLDSQSAMGKLPTQIAQLGNKYGKKVIAIAGQIAADFTDTEKQFYKTLQIDRGSMDIHQAMETGNAIRNLENTVIRFLEQDLNEFSI